MARHSLIGVAIVERIASLGVLLAGLVKAILFKPKEADYINERIVSEPLAVVRDAVIGALTA